MTFARDTIQPRSEQTARRILEEGVRLFAADRLASTRVAEIAAAAGVSVGGFYARYRTKSDLQRAVAEEVLGRVFMPFRERLAVERLAGVGAAGVVRAFAETLVAVFGGRDRDSVRRVVLLVRSDRDLPTSRAIQELNREIQDRLVERLLERRDEIGHPDPRRAIPLAEVALSAAAREMLLHGGTGSRGRLARGRLVDELTALGRAYLRIRETGDLR